MATSRPISSISYNTRSFLMEKLNDLYNRHIISNALVMFHKGEDGDKDHAHFRLELNTRVDPMTLRDEFKELDSNHAKPLWIRPFRFSKEEDFILYVIHDQHYLKTVYGIDKCEKLPYDWHEIISLDGDDVGIAYLRAKAKQKHTGVSIAKSLQTGSSPLDLILSGDNPMLVNSINKALNLNDFNRMSKELGELKGKYELLLQQLRECGLSPQFVHDDEEDISYFEFDFDQTKFFSFLKPRSPHE